MKKKSNVEDKLNWLVENEKEKKESKEREGRIRLQGFEQKSKAKLWDIEKEIINSIDEGINSFKRERNNFSLTIGTFFLGLLIPVLFDESLIAYEIFGVILLGILIWKTKKEDKEILVLKKIREQTDSEHRSNLKKEYEKSLKNI